jgi:hypothetical protein
MKTDTLECSESTPSQHTPLDRETRSNLTTAEAAFHLNRAQQTLRVWACLENGPLRPIRIHGRLAWPVSEIKRLVGWNQS